MPKKDLELQENIKILPENEQDDSQNDKSEKKDNTQLDELSKNSEIQDLLSFFQQMKAEEQRLIEIKQEVLIKQQDLQDRLIKEIEKKKAAIANLTSEIPTLENKNQQLGQALGIDIYK